MHEAQAKDTQPKEQAQPKKRRLKFFVLVFHRIVNDQGQVAPPEFLEFDDKKSMRETLGCKYEGAAFRVFRGYEMKVAAFRRISVN